MPDLFSAATVTAFALGLIAGHWLPRLAWTLRHRRRLRHRLQQLKGGDKQSPSIVPIRRRGA